MQPEEVELINDVHGAIFYASAWLFAYMAGISRQLRDNSNRDLWYCLRIGLHSGFLGFATIGFVVWFGIGDPSDHWPLLALSSLVGLLGKEQERLISFLVGTIFDKLGVQFDEKEVEAADPSRSVDRVNDNDRDRDSVDDPMIP